MPLDGGIAHNDCLQIPLLAKSTEFFFFNPSSYRSEHK
jgi:hypothetical protein